jgi:sirohydrochlorin cobaltochelatase
MNRRLERAHLLFGHGARHPDYLLPFVRLQEAMRAQAPDAAVYVAFLEFTSPSFEAALAKVAADGVRYLQVTPIFFAPGKHVLEDLPRLVREARARYPDMAIVQVPAVGMADPVIAALACYALSADGVEGSVEGS